MSKKTLIKKETWIRLFTLNFYQEFVKEWLDLYDAYMKSNPKPQKEIHMECLDLIINHFKKVKEGVKNG